MDFTRPERCQRQRTGREDRHSKFYETTDNLPALAIGLNFARGTDFGPRADRFYRTFVGKPSRVGREQMLDDLGDAVANNARRFTAKRRALQAALVILAFGLGAAALLIVLA